MSTTTNNTYETMQNPQNVKPASEAPGYVEQASGLLSSVTATAASYLPTGVTNAISGTTVDPTTAYRNHQPHTGGVGDLGTQSTQDVTRLPEERQNPDPLTGQQTSANIGDANPAYNDSVNIQNQYNTRSGETFPSSNAGVGNGITGTVAGLTGLGSTTGAGITGVGGHKGQPGGVGDLGTTSTADVALLPEERANPDPLSSTTTTGTGTGTAGSYGVGGHPGAQGGVGDLGTNSTSDVAVLPEERETTDTTGSSARATDTTGSSTRATEDAAITPGGLGGHGGRHHDMTMEGSVGGASGASYDVDHGLGMPHTRSMAPTSNNTDTNTDTSSSNTNITPVQSQSHGSNVNDDEDVASPKEAGYPTGKPKLMDKVKGSIIVAKAKAVGHNDEEKIRQGTMLKETGKLVNPEEEARRAGTNI